MIHPVQVRLLLDSSRNGIDVGAYFRRTEDEHGERTGIAADAHVNFVVALIQGLPDGHEWPARCE